LSKFWQRSTQGYFVALIVVIAFPLLAFIAFLLASYTTNERSRLEHDAEQLARQISLIVDSELTNYIVLLKVLSSSSSLGRKDFADFHAEARRIVEGTENVIILRDGTRQILNSRVPHGMPVPTGVPFTQREREAYAAGRPVVSGAYAAPTANEIRIVVAIPLPDGLVLGVTIPTTRIRDAVVRVTPPGWVIGIGDADGKYVTRSARHEEVSGKPAVREYIEKATGDAGTFRSRSLDGAEILAGYRRSPLSGWLVATNIPTSVVEAPLWRSVTLLVTIGIATLILSFFIAYLFGRKFTAATADLVKRAAMLGGGQPILPMRSAFSEFNLVGEALASASASIRERTHELETVLATVPAAVLFKYGESGRIVPNPFALALLRIGDQSERVLSGYSSLFDHVQFKTDGRALTHEQMPLATAMRGEAVSDQEIGCTFADGSSCTILTSAAPLHDESGSIVGAVSVSLDITERKKNEEQRRLLMNELNHRVKNTLATVQSLAQQTLRDTAPIAESRSAFNSRLFALSRAHDVLTRENWEGANLRDIANATAETHGGVGRFALEGPPVWLSPSLSLSLFIAFHELATNALKYGALSTESGGVGLSWSVEGSAESQTLTITWREHGGPTVKAPVKAGFGTTLIKRSLAAERDASVVIDYRPGGLVCEMTARIEV
jgi:two-component sensor histidine kinase/PAS domain-containing protein